MIKLSRTVAYALQATLMLAEMDTNQPIPCNRLAAQGGLPERFLLQILRSLVNHGILVSTRGVEGGYRLGRRPSDITLLEIFDAIEGSEQMTGDRPWPGNRMRGTQARLQSVLNGVHANCRRELAAVRLSSLLADVAGT